MLMNASAQPARLRYEPNGFRVMMAGKHVNCAVSGEPILLEVLRYWSVERQEAYASAELATQRLGPQG